MGDRRERVERARRSDPAKTHNRRNVFVRRKGVRPSPLKAHTRRGSSRNQRKTKSKKKKKNMTSTRTFTAATGSKHQSLSKRKHRKTGVLIDTWQARAEIANQGGGRKRQLELARKPQRTSRIFLCSRERLRYPSWRPPAQGRSTPSSPGSSGNGGSKVRDIFAQKAPVFKMSYIAQMSSHTRRGCCLTYGAKARRIRLASAGSVRVRVNQPVQWWAGGSQAFGDAA